MLPIEEIIPEIHQRLSERNTLIVQAAPGAGKSTYLPITLMDLSWLKGKKIMLLEPRRLAVQAIANRLAQQLGEMPGKRIGYRVRFDSRVGSLTQVEVITESILTRMLLDDPALEDVGMVILDEFHERSLASDTAFVLSRECQKILRPDLRILVMSATLEGEKISRYMDHCPVIKSEGRQYPVEIHYAPSIRTDATLAQQVIPVITKVIQVHTGDILVFLPGTSEIHKIAELLESSQSMKGIQIHKLYGDLSFELQQKAILPDPANNRKVILSTSIAETSLTIEGVRMVIDSGFTRKPLYDAHSGLSRLETVRISQDEADQRAGRAGRLDKGFAYRLWSPAQQANRAPARKPEILDADLSSLVLELKSWGCTDITQLDWPDAPPAKALNYAETLLEKTGALKAGSITAEGKKMLELPTHPRIARLLITGIESGAGALAADIAALLEERDPCPLATHADISFRLETLAQWRNKQTVFAQKHVLERIDRLSALWKKKLKSPQNQWTDTGLAGKLIASAYPERVAKRVDKQGLRYKLSSGRSVRLQDHDPLGSEEWIAIALMDAGQQEGKVFLAAALDIMDLSSHMKQKDTLRWDSVKGEMAATRDLTYEDLVVESKALTEITEIQRVQVLKEALDQNGLKLLRLEEEDLQLQSRILSLRVWRPEEAWPDVSDSALLQTPEKWLFPFAQTVRNTQDFKKLNFKDMIFTLLSWSQQQALESLAPEKIQVPSGSKIRLQYSAEGTAPVLPVRLQEVFGLENTPVINAGRIPLIIHLLSPAYRPVQVTQDLKNFWSTTYFEVRKDLRGRYPKHAWPDDPLNAQAVAGAKRRK